MTDTPRVTPRHTDYLITKLKVQRRHARRDQTTYMALVLYVIGVSAVFMPLGQHYGPLITIILSLIIGAMLLTYFYCAAKANWIENEIIETQQAVDREWSA